MEEQKTMATGRMIWIAILFPVIGIIVGIVGICKDREGGLKLLLISICSWFVLFIVLSLMFIGNNAMSGM